MTVTNVSNATTFSSLSSNTSTAPIVTISQGTLSLPVLGVGQILQGPITSHGTTSQEPFSNNQPQFSSSDSVSLPSLMSARDGGSVLLSPPMTRDQMMSSTMMPRDQMLSSHINPINPKLISVPVRKDQIMSSSRGNWKNLFNLYNAKYFCVSDQLLSPMMSPTDAIISSPSQISSLSGELLSTSPNQLSASHSKDDPMSTLTSPQHKDQMMQSQCQQVRDQSLMSPLLSPQDSLPLSPSLGRDQLGGPLSPNSPLPLPSCTSPLPSHQESWDEDKSSKYFVSC